MLGVNQTQGEGGLVRQERLMHFTAGFNLQLTHRVKSGHQVFCVCVCVFAVPVRTTLSPGFTLNVGLRSKNIDVITNVISKQSDVAFFNCSLIKETICSVKYDSNMTF